MHPLKENLISILSLNRRERRGTFVLGLIVVIIAFLPWIKSQFMPAETIEFEKFRKQIEIQYGRIIPDEIKNRSDQMRTARKLFLFDPNVATNKELKSLGIPDFLVKRIIKYRNSGGRFSKVEDLHKLYGMDDVLYNKLSPYVSIALQPKKEFNKPAVKRKIPIVDLNVGDSLSFTSLTGIGPVLASRILKFRERLGGFYAVEQLKEVYGIRDSLYQQLLPQIIFQSKVIRTVDINKANIQELRKHPYLKDYNLSKALIKYREAHGDYRHLEELKNIHLINDSIFNRILPYLSIE